jgi:hypothetical protein
MSGRIRNKVPIDPDECPCRVCDLGGYARRACFRGCMEFVEWLRRGCR